MVRYAKLPCGKLTDVGVIEMKTKAFLRISVTLPLLLTAFGEENPYYAGKDNPLVQLGSQRVLKTIDYPGWFLYPIMPREVRQRLVDLYTTREFLRSFDESTKTAPATKYNYA